MAKLLIATADAFTKANRFVAAGQTVSADEVDWEKGEPGFIEAPSGVDGSAVVEVSAIAPTGPNPTNPQQISPTTVQTSEGYVDSGAILVGEVTQPAKVRITDRGLDKGDDTQAKITQAVEDARVEEREAAAEQAEKDAKARRAEQRKERAAATS